MNLQTEKLTIIQQLIQVDDEALLAAVKNMLEFGLKRQGSAQSDFWEELSEEQRERVELSIRQLDEGTGIPHEEVMDVFRKKYGA